jgi:hypothetical protein
MNEAVWGRWDLLKGGGELKVIGICPYLNHPSTWYVILYVCDDYKRCDGRIRPTAVRAE